MTERADRPLLASMNGMPEPKRPVEDAGLLIPGQTVRPRGWRVSEQIPGATVEPPRAHIRACSVGGVVPGFAAGQRSHEVKPEHGFPGCVSADGRCDEGEGEG